MKQELKRAIIHENRWVTIIYYNERCSGTIKVKPLLYSVKQKKIDKLLKDMIVEILEEGGEQ